MNWYMVRAWTSDECGYEIPSCTVLNLNLDKKSQYVPKLFEITNKMYVLGTLHYLRDERHRRKMSRIAQEMPSIIAKIVIEAKSKGKKIELIFSYGVHA